MNDEDIQSLEGVANTLRGMTMDRRIPEDTRAAILPLIETVDRITEACILTADEGEGE